MRRRVLTAALICGAAFLALFAIGLHFILGDVAKHPITLVERRVMLNALTLAGLFAASRLVVITAVLLPVDTLSGEIASGVIQTVASKPIRRRDIVLGKWLGHWLVMACYLALLVGYLTLAVAVSHTFTDFGHLAAAAIGLAWYPLWRGTQPDLEPALPRAART